MNLTTEDRLAIHELYSRYNHAIDFGDPDAWADCFVDDGVFESGQGSFKGRDQLRAFAQGYAERITGRHWTNNILVEPAGNGAASGKCYLMLYRLDGEKGPSILVTGVYNDTLTQDNGAWRFASRTVAPDVV